MEQRITIARPAAEVFAYLADPSRIRDWLPQLRREGNSAASAPPSPRAATQRDTANSCREP